MILFKSADIYANMGVNSYVTDIIGLYSLIETHSPFQGIKLDQFIQNWPTFI